jgi:hypothetical protein
MNRLISLLILMALLMLGTQPSATDADEANKINRFTVHGRLSRYNGNPSHRIWIVGTHRLLGISESINEVPSMPEELLVFLSSDKEVFADFVVEALTPSKQTRNHANGAHCVGIEDRRARKCQCSSFQGKA